jgi:hypothetical protein
MHDEIDKMYEELRKMVKDYFGIRDEESHTLMGILKFCAIQVGIPVAGAGAVVLAGTGTVVLPVVGSVPGWLAGALAGFVGGTTACAIVHRALFVEKVKVILGQHGVSESEFKHVVRRLISLAEGNAGYYSRVAVVDHSRSG